MARKAAGSSISTKRTAGHGVQKFKGPSASRGTAKKGVRSMGRSVNKTFGLGKSAQSKKGPLNKLGPKKPPGIFGLGSGAKATSRQQLPHLGQYRPIRKGR